MEGKRWEGLRRHMSNAAITSSRQNLALHYCSISCFIFPMRFFCIHLYGALVVGIISGLRRFP
jgi:hypothetical protein